MKTNFAFVFSFLGSTGLYANVYINDVWKSTNLGVSWSISTSVASWAIRGYHSSVVIDSTIYLMGGYGGSSTTYCKCTF